MMEKYFESLTSSSSIDSIDNNKSNLDISDAYLPDLTLDDADSFSHNSKNNSDANNNDDDNNNDKPKRNVSFGHLDEISFTVEKQKGQNAHEMAYPMTLGVCVAEASHSIDDYEQVREPHRRKGDDLRTRLDERKQIIKASKKLAEEFNRRHGDRRGGGPGIEPGQHKRRNSIGNGEISRWTKMADFFSTKSNTSTTTTTAAAAAAAANSSSVIKQPSSERFTASTLTAGGRPLIKRQNSIGNGEISRLTRAAATWNTTTSSDNSNSNENSNTGKTTSVTKSVTNFFKKDKKSSSENNSSNSIHSNNSHESNNNTASDTTDTANTTANNGTSDDKLFHSHTDNGHREITQEEIEWEAARAAGSNNSNNNNSSSSSSSTTRPSLRRQHSIGNGEISRLRKSSSSNGRSRTERGRKTKNILKRISGKITKNKKTSSSWHAHDQNDPNEYIDSTRTCDSMPLSFNTIIDDSSDSSTLCGGHDRDRHDARRRPIVRRQHSIGNGEISRLLQMNSTTGSSKKLASLFK